MQAASDMTATRDRHARPPRVTATRDRRTRPPQRMAAAAGVLYNASGSVRCNELPADADYVDGNDGIWDYQYCTQRLPQVRYGETRGDTGRYARSGCPR